MRRRSEGSDGDDKSPSLRGTKQSAAIHPNFLDLMFPEKYFKNFNEVEEDQQQEETKKIR